jgi:hypothetical protein
MYWSCDILIRNIMDQNTSQAFQYLKNANLAVIAGQRYVGYVQFSGHTTLCQRNV